MSHTSWGRYPPAQQQVRRLSWRHDALPEPAPDSSCLPYGLGRSYGDSCLNDGGTLLLTRGLNRFIHLDTEQGRLRCEAGTSLAEILELIVPRGWFLPVSPGTKFVTVGGAIANDVHGKNHHRAGTFGCHLEGFELLRSDGSRRYCSPEQHTDWFEATIGGLGLTGLITWATFRLKPIYNPFIEVEDIKFRNVDAFFELAAASDADYEYTVSWIDCLASGDSLGRGIYMRGNTAPPGREAEGRTPPDKQKTFPMDAPGFLLNQLSVKAFNTVFYHKQLRERRAYLKHYEPFFYPLDSVHHWNRMYGKRGFFQHQCVVPFEASREPIKDILHAISDAGQGSFLAVLKVFGDRPSPGLLSFPRAGVTLALDFANKGERTFQLMERLDAITAAAGGAVYPAKDARMSASHFQTFFPQWPELEPFIDPAFSSQFWRRVTPSGASS